MAPRKTQPRLRRQVAGTRHSRLGYEDAYAQMVEAIKDHSETDLYYRLQKRFLSQSEREREEHQLQMLDRHIASLYRAMKAMRPETPPLNAIKSRYTLH